MVLTEKIDIGREVRIEGPPLEALRFQGARPGSIVTVTDVMGRDYRGRVISLATKASVLIFEAFKSPTESPFEMVLLQALPKKERMELIIQKTTELGVSAIIPFKAERSICLEQREARQQKAHRWQEIAIKAAKQSRRARVPGIAKYCSMEEALYTCGEGLRILLWEREGTTLKDVLQNYSVNHVRSGPSASLPEISRIYGMVGPEGGFTEKEVGLAQGKGFIPVKLGQRILRTETAAIVLVGIVQYELGDLG